MYSLTDDMADFFRRHFTHRDEATATDAADVEREPEVERKKPVPAY